MNTLLLIVAACVGLATAGTWTEEMTAALSAENQLNARQDVSAEETGDQKIDSGCSCSRVGCECWGRDGDISVNASLVYDELRHGSDHGHVVGRFWVGDMTFQKIWCVNKVKSFCKLYKGKRFCFKVEVDDDGGDFLYGCLRITRPHRVPMGCFKLPL
ncbi:uncharacterized protein LOC127846986 [Dreissena polymorpha]|uniref:uncharacterized protein LOC127846986 n=1 Tax=Dreissena polymorpha TaxID=45954 RepID=UPI00226511E7|nr:uncharacterized protein LOC127846986 [Dreissena polymorpha]